MKIETGLEMLAAGQIPFPCLIQNPSVSPKPVLPLQKHNLYICCSTSNASFQWGTQSLHYNDTRKPLISILLQSAAQGAGMVQCTVSCTHGCKEIYFQVSTNCCSSGFLFHLRLPSLGRTLKKQAEQGVCALAVVQQGQVGCTLRSRIPAGAPCAALGGGNKAGSSMEGVCLALLKSMQIWNKGWSSKRCCGHALAGTMQVAGAKPKEWPKPWPSFGSVTPICAHD